MLKGSEFKICEAVERKAREGQEPARVHEPFNHSRYMYVNEI